MQIRIPTPVTLKKYGMTSDDFVSLWNAQDGKCAICGNTPSTGRLCIDHQHGIRGWKKLPNEKRKATVRGLLCWTCNRLIVGRGVTIERLEKALEYMKRFTSQAEDTQSPVFPKAAQS